MYQCIFVLFELFFSNIFFNLFVSNTKGKKCKKKSIYFTDFPSLKKK